VDVRITFEQASETKFTKKVDTKRNPTGSRAPAVVPAIDVGTEVLTSTGLPSIMQADTDLIMVFLTNLTSSLLVEHNAATGESKLILTDESVNATASVASST
jgi:hypothetical protein